jgi:antibiotic biosynthesis monooxygenase (ABM) superfamily enzyme
VAVFSVSTYVVKPDKRKEHLAWGKTLVASMKENPELFEEVKSLKVLSQKDGNTKRYLAIWEFKNQADRKNWQKKLQKLKEGTDLTSDFTALLEPGTFSSNVWKPVKSMRRVNSSK